MRKRARWAVAWALWLGAFGVLELLAVLDPATGDTFSEQVWWLSFLDGIGPVMTALIAGFMGWLTIHFVGPGLWRHVQQWQDRQRNRRR